jgi:hypothetical protein
MTKPLVCQTAAMHDGVDRVVAVLDPVEGKTLPAPQMHGVFDADARIEQPFPGGAGDDETERHRIEIDRPQHAFAADLLIEQNRQEQTDHGADEMYSDAKTARLRIAMPQWRQLEQARHVVLASRPD